VQGGHAKKLLDAVSVKQPNTAAEALMKELDTQAGLHVPCMATTASLTPHRITHRITHASSNHSRLTASSSPHHSHRITHASPHHSRLTASLTLWHRLVRSALWETQVRHQHHQRTGSLATGMRMED
jgi:hypothetical protein